MECISGQASDNQSCGAMESYLSASLVEVKASHTSIKPATTSGGTIFSPALSCPHRRGGLRELDVVNGPLIRPSLFHCMAIELLSD